jgi:F5/8 type C domain-containing protein
MSSPTSRLMARRGGPEILTFALYVLFAIALTYPLIVRLGTAVPNDLGDPLLNVWILWWNATHVPLTAGWWNLPSFYPGTSVLTFSEHLAGLAPISTPVYWLTGNVLIGYNVVFLLTFSLSAFGGYLLCLHLTGRRDAAFLGGLAFGFAPYRISQLAHLQVLASFWMPVALLGLHRFVRGDGWQWLVLFAVMWVMQALTNGYYMAFFSVLVALWIVWFVPWRRWRTGLAVVGALALAFAALLPILIRYRQVHDALGFRRLFEEILAFSADLTSIFDASGMLALWGWVHSLNRPEDELFPGLTVVLLIGMGLLVKDDLGFRFAVFAKRNPRSFLRLGLFLIGVILATAAVIAVVSPGETSIAGLTISANHPEKPMLMALVCFLAVVATSPSVAAAVRSRSAFAFYVGAAVVMWLFSLGPTVNLLDKPLLPTAPYAWLLPIPGWDGFRVPARFAMLMVLCLATAAALAYSRLTTALPYRRRVVVASILTATLLADGWMRTMPLERAPEPWPRGTAQTTGAILSLPLGHPGDDLKTMYRAVQYGRPIVNGYSGYFPPWYPSLRAGLDAKDPSMLEELSVLGVTEIVVDASIDKDGALDAYARTKATRLNQAGGPFAFYRLSPSRQQPAGENSPSGAAVSIHAIDVNVKPEQAAAMTDGDLETRWDTGPQTGKEQVIVDLGMVRTATAVVMSLGPFANDFPRDLQVQVSTDGRSWIETWRGSVTTRTFVAAVRDPKRVPIVISLGQQPARYIRLRQHGVEPTYYWSIAELSVH